MDRKYELVGVYPTKVNEIVAEKSLAELCKTNGFKIAKVDKWGVRNLAYPIKKETKGYYLRLEIEGGDAKALASSLKIDETMLRYLLIRVVVKGKEKK